VDELRHQRVKNKLRKVMNSNRFNDAVIERTVTRAPAMCSVFLSRNKSFTSVSRDFKSEVQDLNVSGLRRAETLFSGFKWEDESCVHSAQLGL
jgi:hypothetical protein